MAIFTKDQINLVNRRDCLAQDKYPVFDRKFQRIYQRADNTGYGWETIAEKEPVLFAEALTVALEMEGLE